MPNHTLQATALVHEAYLRLAQVERIDYHDRTHFIAMAATMMRRQGGREFRLRKATR